MLAGIEKTTMQASEKMEFTWSNIEQWNGSVCDICHKPLVTVVSDPN